MKARGNVWILLVYTQVPAVCRVRSSDSGVSSLCCYNEVFNPSLGEVHGRFLVGSKLEIKDVFVLFLLLVLWGFFLSFFFFFCFPLSLLFSQFWFFGGSLWTKKPLKFCLRFCLFKSDPAFREGDSLSTSGRCKPLFRQRRLLGSRSWASRYSEPVCEPIVSLVPRLNQPSSEHKVEVILPFPR